MPDISVLIPCYNGAKTLAKSIQSILDQDFRDFELILIDDCSSDNTSDIIAQFAIQDPRIRPIYHKVNIGLAETLNEGLALASAPLVARLDQDDEALPHRLRVQYAYMLAHPEVTVAGSHVYFAGKHTKYDKLEAMATTHEEIAEILPKYNCMFHPAIIMRKDAILKMGGYKKEFKNAEDYDLWLRVAKQGRLGNVAEPLTRYTFSVHGMTLGKKWQQLYYVYLAQLSNLPPERSFIELEKLAAAQLESTNRKEFFNCVVAGTLDKLTDLRLWHDAFSLTFSMSKEIGFTGTLSYIFFVVKKFFTVK